MKFTPVAIAIVVSAVVLTGCSNEKTKPGYARPESSDGVSQFNGEDAAFAIALNLNSSQALDAINKFSKKIKNATAITLMNELRTYFLNQQKQSLQVITKLNATPAAYPPAKKYGLGTQIPAGLISSDTFDRYYMSPAARVESAFVSLMGSAFTVMERPAEREGRLGTTNDAAADFYKSFNDPRADFKSRLTDLRDSLPKPAHSTNPPAGGASGGPSLSPAPKPSPKKS